MKAQLLEHSLADIHLSVGSSLQIIDLLDHQKGTKTITLEQDSNLLYFCYVQDAQVDLHVRLLGESAHLVLHSLSFSHNHSLASSHISVYLSKNHTFAQVSLMSVVSDRADVFLDGSIIIEPGISGAQGYLSEHHLLLGSDVKITTLPVLDVRSYDVQASHGATIQRLDKEKLFYMMAKGLDMHTSQKLVLEGSLRHMFAEFDDFDEDSKERLVHRFLKEYFV